LRQALITYREERASQALAGNEKVRTRVHPSGGNG